VIGFGRPAASTHIVTFGGPFSGLSSHGGHAQGSFGGAGSDARSTNLRMAATLRLVARW